MEDCKCGRIPPCYSGKKFRIHEELEKIKAWDKTPDMIYELNRQMCDIDKHLSEAGYFGMICEGQVEARKKLKDMEKKTKKMTKAEAFEYLKGKKVYCYDGTNTLYCKLVKKLLACGCDYKGFMCPHNYSVSALAIDREGRVGHVPTEVFERYINIPFEAISADDILSIVIVDDKDNIAEKNAFLQARDIMKWLREKQSPHTLMIIDGNHVELLDGVKSEVWKEDME